jgi:hypothetical protein
LVVSVNSEIFLSAKSNDGTRAVCHLPSFKKWLD